MSIVVEVGNSTSVVVQLSEVSSTVAQVGGLQGPAGVDAPSPRSWSMVAFDSLTDCAVGDGTIGFAVPALLNGYELIDVLAAVDSAGIGGTMDIQVRRKRGATVDDMLSTVVTVDHGSYYANDGVIDLAADDLLTGDMIYIDVDVVHSTTASKGLTVTLTADLP